MFVSPLIAASMHDFFSNTLWEASLDPSPHGLTLYSTLSSWFFLYESLVLWLVKAMHWTLCFIHVHNPPSILPLVENILISYGIRNVNFLHEVEWSSCCLPSLLKDLLVYPPPKELLHNSYHCIWLGFLR